MPNPVVRFAPSPTGRIHIGNTRPALLNYLFAKARDGTFVLRFDDTDTERSRLEYAEAIADDLHWLGVVPDLVVRQSDRTSLYAAATERLKQNGRLYPAYETADELDRRRKRLQARGLPPVYDRGRTRAEPRNAGPPRGRGASSALALQARPGNRRLARSGPRREPHRLRIPVGSGAGPRGWDLSLYPAVRRRRHEPRHNPHHPWRGPRHQYGRPDPDLPGFGPGGSPRVRSPQPARHGLRRRIEQTFRRPVDRSPSVRRGSRLWRSPPWRC